MKFNTIRSLDKSQDRIGNTDATDFGTMNLDSINSLCGETPSTDPIQVYCVQGGPKEMPHLYDLFKELNPN